MKYSSTEIGSATDNPTSALDLTSVQKDRTVTAMYTDVSTFTIEIAATSGSGGRNFLFAMKAPHCRKILFLFL